MRRSDKEITNRDQLEAIIRGSLVCRLALARDNVPINNGEGNASVRDERWYFIRYRDGTEEFYDMERDPIQWTNLAASKDPEIRSQKSRLAASFPVSFATHSIRCRKELKSMPSESSAACKVCFNLG